MLVTDNMCCCFFNGGCILILITLILLYNIVPLREDIEDIGGSSHPGTSQERECEAQHSPSSPGQSIDSSVIKFSFRYFEMLVTEVCCFFNGGCIFLY